MADQRPISDNEREPFIESLRRHFVDGRIDVDGYDERLDLVFAARSRDELDRVLADLPALAPRAAGRPRRHGASDAAADHWRPTNEVFRDPTSGTVTRVWVDPTDGSRHYVPEGAA